MSQIVLPHSAKPRTRTLNEVIPPPSPWERALPVISGGIWFASPQCYCRRRRFAPAELGLIAIRTLQDDRSLRVKATRVLPPWPLGSQCTELASPRASGPGEATTTKSILLSSCMETQDHTVPCMRMMLAFATRSANRGKVPTLTQIGCLLPSAGNLSRIVRSGAKRTRHRIWLLADARSQPASNFGSFCQSQGVFHIDPEISDGAFNLRMSKQDLDCAEVPGRLVDDRRLRTPQRVRAIILAWQADARYPLIHKASVLAGAHMSRMIGAAREGIILQGSAPQLQPPEQTGACIVHQFELDRSPGLLLNDNRPRPNFPVTNDIADLDLH